MPAERGTLTRDKARHVLQPFHEGAKISSVGHRQPATAGAGREALGQGRADHRCSSPGVRFGPRCDPYCLQVRLDSD